jgi:methylaspartate mutase sigma subunit
MTDAGSVGICDGTGMVRGGGGGRTVIVSSMASDSHTWNLVYLELLIGELGFEVINLGACVPDELLESECRRQQPAMVVLSSVNGHGYQEGLRVVQRLRGNAELRDTPMVIGGKLGISGGQSDEQIDRLLLAGFDAVFDDRHDGPASFRKFIAAISGRTPRALRAQAFTEGAEAS